ncbi:hypothetical protein Bhyg_04117 [Pseudolycoriella hygida]|uniref:Uncharacterized protein n=1 Tax=Pseudolycoriella hygida TaxID=35572 RepID=A0A9Q0NEN3_9DIPT|nr:hypothetical protein Bhyg_04117 [Pseudolycoriella hygida]
MNVQKFTLDVCHIFFGFHISVSVLRSDDSSVTGGMEHLSKTELKASVTPIRGIITHLKATVIVSFPIKVTPDKQGINFLIYQSLVLITYRVLPITHTRFRVNAVIPFRNVLKRNATCLVCSYRYCSSVINGIQLIQNQVQIVLLDYRKDVVNKSQPDILGTSLLEPLPSLVLALLEKGVQINNQPKLGTYERYHIYQIRPISVSLFTDIQKMCKACVVSMEQATTRILNAKKVPLNYIYFDLLNENYEIQEIADLQPNVLCNGKHFLIDSWWRNQMPLQNTHNLRFSLISITKKTYFHKVMQTKAEI